MLLATQTEKGRSVGSAFTCGRSRIARWDAVVAERFTSDAPRRCLDARRREASGRQDVSLTCRTQRPEVSRIRGLQRRVQSTFPIATGAACARPGAQSTTRPRDSEAIEDDKRVLQCCPTSVHASSVTSELHGQISGLSWIIPRSTLAIDYRDATGANHRSMRKTMGGKPCRHEIPTSRDSQDLKNRANDEALALGATRLI